VTATLALSRASVAALPGASSSEHGALSSLHGVVSLTPTTATAAHPSLRLAFLSVPVPLSAVTASRSVSTGATGNPGPITLTNRGPHAGSASLFQRHEHPRTREVDVRPDVTGDGQPDYYVFTADTGLAENGEADGTLTAFTVTPDNQLVDRRTASASANGSTTFLPVLASTLGLTAASPAVRVGVAGFSALDDGSDDVARTGRFQPFSPAVSSGDKVTVPAGGSVQVATRINRAQLAGQTSTGWLVVTPDDAAGAEAERVGLQLPAAAVAVTAGR
jgi:hypothetical protein